MGDETGTKIPDAAGPAQEVENPWTLPTAPASAPARSSPPPQKPPQPANTPQPASAPAKAQSPVAFSPSKVPDAPQLLARLKEDILKKGGKWDDRWRVESKMRTSGNTAGTWDSYYFNPEGKRFRSRQEVIKMLGLEGDIKKLSREEAVRRAQALPKPELPLQLDDGIRVTRLGAIDARPTYHKVMQLWPVGYEAESAGHSGCTLRSSIADGGAEGPLFTVALVPSDAGQETAVLASERDPDAAWSKVAAMQQATVGPKKTAKPKKPAPPPASSAPTDMDIDGGDGAKGTASEAMPDGIKALLARIAPLTGAWGTEQYGLADARVVKALEGLEGAENCAGYSFVEQRGTWAAETKRLEKELAAHSKHKQRASKVAKKKEADKAEKAERERARQEAQMAKAVKRARDAEAKKASGKGSAPADAAATNGEEPPAKRKKPSQQTSGKAKGLSTDDMLALLHQEPSKRGPQTTEGVVARVMRRMLDQVERWAEKDAQKEERQRQKKLEREAAQNERLAQHLKAQEAIAQAPQRLVDIEDSRLPGAHLQPPAAAPVAKGLLPASTISGVVELWAFLGRFAELIGLERVPSIAELEADLAAPPGPRNITTSALMQLVQLVATEVFQSALDVAREMDPDLIKLPLSGAQPSIREDTWIEVARRLFLLAGASELVAAGDGSGGLDIALGPTLGSSPLGALGPSIILPGLVAGPSTLDPRLTPAALPLGACTKAPQAILARHDGRARAHAARLLADSAPHESDADVVAAEAERLTRSLRRILLQITLVKGPRDASGAQSTGSVLCFDGASAAAAAKIPQPLDLLVVAARLDAGFYAALGDEGLEVFAADVTAVLENFKAAAKRSGLEVAARLGERKAADVAELALGVLRSLLEQHRSKQGAAAKGPKGKHGDKAAKSKAGDAEEDEEAVEEDRRERTIVDDLSRPFVPWEGCAACWSNDDHRNILLCDGCDLEFHHYCVVPPLPDIPSGEWFCPACVRAGNAAGQQPASAADEPHPAVQRSEFQRAVELLGTTEYADLTPVQRVEVARLLLSLASSSSLIRDELEEDAEKKKALRRELNDLRMKIRREAHERDERDRAEKAQREAAEAKKVAAKGNAASKGAKPSSKEDIPAALLVDDSVKMTRAREAELAEAARDAQREREILEEVDMVGRSRCEALGFDRHWNCYWLLGAWEGNSGGMVYVEKSQSGTSPRENLHNSAAAEPEQSPGGDDAPWGCYTGGAAIDALIEFLNPVGLRENALRRALQRVRPTLAEPAQPEPAKAAAAKPAKISNDSAVRDAALDNQPPLPENTVDPMEIDGRAEVTAVASKAEPSADAKPLDLRTADIRKLAGEIMAFEEGPASDALDTGGPTWPYEGRRRWRFLLETTTQLPQIMAALLVLESALKPERLKPFWLLWAFPAPNPELAGTLPAVRLRLLALKSALKRGGGGGAAATAAAPREAAAAPARHGRALRDRGRPAGTVARLQAAEAVATDESEADAPQPRKRPAQRPTARELADEELARKLQAEENARSSRRSDRASRLAAASERGRRSTRSAAAVLYASSEGDSDSDVPRRRTRHAAKEGPVDPYRRTRGARAVLADDQGGSEEGPPGKTRAALQHLEAARKGRAGSAADTSDDISDSSDDDQRPATRVIEGRRRLRKRA
ncbi:hypothetical protein WJX75_008430 [Coccomyxa subellipsoidea]|uniref:PHD-type domain-containing protein n=1 Tax=Coccomyxa subellipsoidea TaxID=248742 RepID=A0ABR2Z5C9_9CHLO